jgi:hypothetical protein
VSNTAVYSTPQPQADLIVELTDEQAQVEMCYAERKHNQKVWDALLPLTLTREICEDQGRTSDAMIAIFVGIGFDLQPLARDARTRMTLGEKMYTVTDRSQNRRRRFMHRDRDQQKKQARAERLSRQRHMLKIKRKRNKKRARRGK